jgi:predicted histidine transporter YuiF (NhaC family)
MWTAVGAIASLLLAIFVWYVKRTDKKDKAKDELDKEIDNISNADDVTRMGDKLRDK